MTALTRFFFRAPYVAPSSRAILAWWEARRLAYNISVGAAGFTSIVVVAALGALPPHGLHLAVPLQGIVLYAVAANLFYCAGPVLDMLIVRQWGRDFASVGPALFRYGYAFSMGLTLLPIPVSIAGWAFRVLSAR